MKFYLNGKFLEEKDAKIKATDTGFLYGEGAFETMRSSNGFVQFAREHYLRLSNTLKFLGIKIDFPYSKFSVVISKLLKINNLKDAYIRVSISAGSNNKPTVFVMVKKIEKIPAKLLQKGVSLRFSQYRKNNYSALPKYKTLNYLENLREKRNAIKNGYFDSILFDSTGRYITECSTANIFIVKNRILITPALNNSPILPGIMRQAVIKLAQKKGIKVIQKALTKQDLLNADEVFITNSRIGILPVRKIGIFDNPAQMS